MERRIDDTLNHAYFLARHLKVFNPSSAALLVLMELCIPTNCEGHDYLQKAIVRRYHNPEKPFEKGIYDVVADSYMSGLSTFQMESSMRYAITRAWNGRNENTWAIYFPCNDRGKLVKPKNTEFISEIARFLELWAHCYEEVGCCE